VLNLIIAEAALELIPSQIRGRASIRNDARRRCVDPGTMLLDRSLHHAAMLKLDEHYKRGRPDLVHLTLLSATSSPLYQDGQVKVYIHTREDIVLELKERTRPPKSYARFRDLMEHILEERPESGLITVYTSSVRQLLKRIGQGPSFGLSIQGERQGLDQLASELEQAKNPSVLVGGFPRGHFAPETVRSVDRLIRIDERSLDAHVVVARLIYEVEKRTAGAISVARTT